MVCVGRAGMVANGFGRGVDVSTIVAVAETVGVGLADVVAVGLGLGVRVADNVALAGIVAEAGKVELGSGLELGTGVGWFCNAVVRSANHWISALGRLFASMRWACSPSALIGSGSCRVSRRIRARSRSGSALKADAIIKR